MILFGVWVLVYLDLIEWDYESLDGQTLIRVTYVECEMHDTRFL